MFSLILHRKYLNTNIGGLDSIFIIFGAMNTFTSFPLKYFEIFILKFEIYRGI